MHIIERSAELIKSISNYGHEIYAKIIHYFGLTAAAGGVGTGVANDTYTDRLFSGVGAWSIQDWYAVVGIIGGILLAIQTLSNIYWGWKEKKLRHQRLQKTNNPSDAAIEEAANKLIETIAKNQEAVQNEQKK